MLSGVTVSGSEQYITVYFKRKFLYQMADPNETQCLIKVSELQISTSDYKYV